MTSCTADPGPYGPYEMFEVSPAPFWFNPNIKKIVSKYRIEFEGLRNINVCSIPGALARQYYADIRRTNPNANTSEVHDLTEGMIGSEGPSCMMHQIGGAQIRGLLGFIVQTLEKYRHAMDTNVCPYLIRAGKALVRYYEITHSHGRIIPRDAISQMFDCVLSHNSFFERAGGSSQGKSHLALHLVRQSIWLGNPRYRHTYRNESLNGTVATLSRSVHMGTFIRSVLQKWRLLTEYMPQRTSNTCLG